MGEVAAVVACLDEADGEVAGRAEARIGQVENGNAPEVQGNPYPVVGGLPDVQHRVGQAAVLVRQSVKTSGGRIEEHDTPFRPDPDASRIVLVDAVHFTAFQTVRVTGLWHVVHCGLLPDGDDGKTVADMSGIEVAVTAIEYRPQLVVWQSLDGRSVVVGETSGTLVQIVDALPIGGQPDVAVVGGCHMSHVVGYQTLRTGIVMLVIGETSRLVIVGIQSVALRRNPQDRFVRVIEQGIQLVARDAVVVVFVVIQYLNAIEAVQPFFRGEPQESLFVLRDAQDIIVRQSFGKTDRLYGVGLRSRQANTQPRDKKHENSFHHQLIITT